MTGYGPLSALWLVPCPGLRVCRRAARREPSRPAGMLTRTTIPPMFATASLARRIERVEAALIADGAAATRRRLPPGQSIVQPLAGGVASYSEPGSPLNKVAGLGFEGIPDERQLEEIERRGQPHIIAYDIGHISSALRPSVSQSCQLAQVRSPRRCAAASNCASSMPSMTRSRMHI